MFVFGNRARTGIKILVYDGQGFWLCHKRLSSGRFAFWPDGDTPTRTLQACELQVLLMGGDPTRANAAPPWRCLSLAASGNWPLTLCRLAARGSSRAATGLGWPARHRRP